MQIAFLRGVCAALFSRPAPSGPCTFTPFKFAIREQSMVVLCAALVAEVGIYSQRELLTHNTTITQHPPFVPQGIAPSAHTLSSSLVLHAGCESLAGGIPHAGAGPRPVRWARHARASPAAPPVPSTYLHVPMMVRPNSVPALSCSERAAAPDQPTRDMGGNSSGAERPFAGHSARSRHGRVPKPRKRCAPSWFTCLAREISACLEQGAWLCCCDPTVPALRVFTSCRRA